MKIPKNDLDDYERESYAPRRWMRNILAVLAMITASGIFAIGLWVMLK